MTRVNTDHKYHFPMSKLQETLNMLTIQINNVINPDRQLVQIEDIKLSDGEKNLVLVLIFSDWSKQKRYYSWSEDQEWVNYHIKNITPPS